MNPAFEMNVESQPSRAAVAIGRAIEGLLQGVATAMAIVAVVVWTLVYRLDSGDLKRLQRDADYWVYGREPPVVEVPEFAQHAYSTVSQWTEFINYWILCPVVIALLAWVFKRTLKRTVMHFRGIHFESMQTGSDFVEGEIPDYQVSIYNAGTFVDTFIGYGVRFGTMLVVPSHVKRHALLMVAEGKLGKMGISVAPMESRVHSDLTYYPLTEAQWSRLGVAQPRVPKKVMNALVSCTGRKGTTSGLVSRIEALGILKYAGSTIGGMSGAAYFSGQTVHGVHTGSAGDFNVGVSSVLIMAEVRKLVGTACVGETPTLEEMRGLNRASAAKVKSGWNTDSLLRQIDETYSRDCEWAEDRDFDYGAQLDFEADGEATISEKWLNDFMRLPMAQKQSALVALQGLTNADRKVTGQSDGASSEVTLPKDFVTMRFEALEKRMEKVEEAVAKQPIQKVKTPNPGAQQMDSTLPYVCGFSGHDSNGDWRCRRGFTTEAARLQHQIVKGHVEVTGESAFSGDVRMPLATRPVFRKRRFSPNRSTRSWSSTSNSVEQPTPSTSQIQNQSPTPTSTEQTLKSLVESLQAMAGQISAIMPNSKV